MNNKSKDNKVFDEYIYIRNIQVFGFITLKGIFTYLHKSRNVNTKTFVIKQLSLKNLPI